jgi:hypothetical protein
MLSARPPVQGVSGGVLLWRTGLRRRGWGPCVGAGLREAAWLYFITANHREYPGSSHDSGAGGVPASLACMAACKAAAQRACALLLCSLQAGCCWLLRQALWQPCWLWSVHCLEVGLWGSVAAGCCCSSSNSAASPTLQGVSTSAQHGEQAVAENPKPRGSAWDAHHGPSVVVRGVLMYRASQQQAVVLCVESNTAGTAGRAWYWEPRVLVVSGAGQCL